MSISKQLGNLESPFATSLVMELRKQPIQLCLTSLPYTGGLIGLPTWCVAARELTDQNNSKTLPPGQHVSGAILWE